MAEAVPTSYDEVPYDSYPFSQSHPDRLATVATLLGLKPPPVGQCRVLELGCASGGNLIPMALSLPDSTFVGVDQSGRQAADGQKVIAALGLKNIELKHLSILDIHADFGTFDYIIVHGVYSWVPATVQDKILDICAHHLAPTGVAYISYNTYPGWHLRGLIRDIMTFHARQFSQPQVRARQARNLLSFLAKAVAKENSAYSQLLKAEAELLRNRADCYVLHDHLEEINDPVYFYQFAERAAAKGLRYLGETEISSMMPSNYPPEVENVLQLLATDVIHLEQYMDFVRNRTFRQTLLCHQDLTPDYTISPERLKALYVASAAKAGTAQPALHSNAVEEFKAQESVTLSTKEPLIKAALVTLSEAWPRALAFDTLLATARARLHPAAAPDPATLDRDAQQLARCLLTAYTSASTGLLDLHVHPPRLAGDVSECPVASLLARLQAATGNRVTNLCHELVTLDELERHLLPQLDGSRDRAALVETLAGLALRGVLQVHQGGQPVRDGETLRKLLDRALEQQLPKLARNALLVG
jgi:methyltransferase-like protein/cyclopropane fatty-acyl-phospholipid synthase-like methyltransferase